MNLNVVCPHCFEVSSVEKKASYTQENCTACGESLLESELVEGNANILKNFTTNSELPVIVDFWAPWCGPCLQMAPHFEDAAMAMPLQAQFMKINNDDEQTLGSKLCIASIPAVLVFKGGKEIDRFEGARSSEQIQAWVKQYL
ncbi:MAG: thioredoxin domain-containing protein [Campylobacterota bacterium]|nr:thioredoxin domain-containing protein [Campylobacterota bacterium]